MFPLEKPAPRAVGVKDKKMKAALNKTKDLNEEINLRL